MARPVRGGQPRKGCILQPKVAVLSYLGNYGGLRSNPERVHLHRQQDELRALLRKHNVGWDALYVGLSHNPVGVGRRRPFPRVAEYSNPGLSDATPSG